MSLTAGSVVVASRSQIASAIGDEVVVLELDQGAYFGLTEVGAFVWERIQEPARVGDLRSAITEAFEVDAEICERDLLDLLEDMRSNGLIEVVGAAPSTL
jgi:hypothetical protein